MNTLDLAALAAEPLNPELEAYVTDGPLGPMLKHPLVYDLTVRSLPGMANRIYAQKQAQLTVAKAKGDFSQALMLHERPYRMTRLAEYWAAGHFGKDRLSTLLAFVWVDTEMPSQFGPLPLQLFKAAGFTTDDPAGWDGLRAPLRLYRGGLRPTRYAISWTLSQEKAQWFARRFSTVGRVWTATLDDKARALGYFTGRNEQEVVVAPSSLSHVEAY